MEKNNKLDHNEYEEDEYVMTEEKINKLLEEGEALGSEMDESSLILCLKNLREKIKVNSDLRVKFAGDTKKYVDSEVDLHEEIKILQRIAAYPNLIKVFTDEDGVELLMTMLNHDNFDIVDDAVVLIEEITDSDYLQDIQNPKEFLELFITNNLFDLLVNNLFRIDDISNKEDEQTVTDILSVLENFLDVYLFSSKLLSERTKLLNWLIARVKIEATAVNNNKLFASELLYTISQSCVENKILSESLPHLLMVLMKHQNKKITDNNEEEFLHNIINTLCSLLLFKDNQSIFRQSDGVRIVLNMLRENNLFRHAGIKILDFATQNNIKNTKELVSNDGLGGLFSYFMGKGLKNLRKFESFNGEEHCLSILSNLCKYLKGVEIERFIYKFKENKNEKCERLIELYRKFEKLSNSFKKSVNEREDDDETEVEEDYNSGLFNLQNICIIIGFLFTTHHNDIKSKLINLMSINNIKIEKIKSILIEHSSHLGEHLSDEEVVGSMFSIKNFIERLIKNLF